MHALHLYILLKNARCTYQHGYVHRLQAWDANVLLALRRLLFIKAWEPSTLMLRVTQGSAGVSHREVVKISSLPRIGAEVEAGVLNKQARTQDAYSCLGPSVQCLSGFEVPDKQHSC